MTTNNDPKITFWLSQTITTVEFSEYTSSPYLEVFGLCLMLIFCLAEFLRSHAEVLQRKKEEIKSSLVV